MIRIVIQPFSTSELVHPHYLDEFISSFRDLQYTFSFLLYFGWKISVNLQIYSVDPIQMPHSCLHCLHLSPKPVSSLKRVMAE